MTQENGSFTELMAKIAKENEEFLAGKGRGVYSEVVELASDAIDYIMFAADDYIKFAAERKEALEDYVKHPMLFFICSILMPLSNGMYSDLLIGNLPACFMGLRLMLESLAKCYIAESHPDKDSFFEVKLLTLENFLKGERISISELLKYYGEMTGLKDEPVKLWGKISEGWIHTRGIVEKIVDQVVKTGRPPSYGLVIPMYYGEGDLDHLNELGKRTAEFRKLLKVTIEKYKKKQHRMPKN